MSEAYRLGTGLTFFLTVGKRSPKICSTPEGPKQGMASHLSALLQASKIAHEEEQPIGKQRSIKIGFCQFMPKME